MIKLSLKTRISLYVSGSWLVFSFFIATTYSKLNNQIILGWFDLHNVYWHIFFIVGVTSLAILARNEALSINSKNSSQEQMKINIGIFQYEMQDESPFEKISRLETHLNETLNWI